MGSFKTELIDQITIESIEYNLITRKNPRKFFFATEKTFLF